MELWMKQIQVEQVVLYVFSKYLVDGYYTWYADTYSSNIASGVNQSEIEIWLLIVQTPVVVITAPPSIINFQRLNRNVSLNWTATDTNLGQCIVGYDSSNSTVTCGDETFDINITSSSQPKNLTFGLMIHLEILILQM